MQFPLGQQMGPVTTPSPSGDGFSIHRRPVLVPGKLPEIEAVIVQAPVRLQSDAKLSLLVRVREQTITIRMAHDREYHAQVFSQGRL